MRVFCAYCKNCRVNLGSKSSGWPNVSVLIFFKKYFGAQATVVAYNKVKVNFVTTSGDPPPIGRDGGRRRLAVGAAGGHRGGRPRPPGRGGRRQPRGRRIWRGPARTSGIGIGFIAHWIEAASCCVCPLYF